MSDLANRNRDAMITATERFSAQVDEMKGMIIAQNSKIASLVAEVSMLKEAQIMATVISRIEATGHGGTD